MVYLQNIGAYFLMITEMFRKPTKWTVMKHLILKEVEDLVIGSLGIVAFSDCCRNNRGYAAPEVVLIVFENIIDFSIIIVLKTRIPLSLENAL